ncbi:MAG: hypothetical protein MI864_13710 [Pseudomonadales bacterium]|uniref:Uncharacterized protein n=1 Tax=Oleiphilus messinensis TaxID=141451 RepID=A0A1Y0I9D8_9GAMM|nr:hypothetical protein [Oleiphilus messinensis]ARU57128.1 hypothetical protein OLMES_3085 [Oleiphilus messinensis]MCG8611582.1 hypothetical protein [Pseudomonadales bacterium]
MKFIVKSVLLVLLTISVNAAAKTALNGEVIDNLIASMKEIQVWADKNKNRMNYKDDDMSDMSADKIIAEIKAMNAYGEVEDIVEKHNFDSVEDWADVMTRTMKALMANAMQMSGGFQDQMQQQMQQMMNDPNISEQQKQAMKQMMENIKPMQTMENMANGADPADIEAIKPHMNKLQALAEDGQ